ncbi:MAG TPA: hypothetical protein ENN03_08465 [bacterium]|nr:hypothetical protein [bacterium]
MKIRISYIALIGLAATLPLFAQAPFEAGGSLTLAFPQNEFADNVDNLGFGASGNFLARFPGSPLAIGGSFTFLIYGSETRKEPLIPPVYVDVTTTNAIIMGHVLLRIQPSDGPLVPYADGLLGFNFLTTDSRIENEQGEEIASSNNFRDITFGYGAGAGVKIRVHQKPDRKSWETGISAVYLDLGARYLMGGEAEYLKKGSIEIDGDDVRYTVVKSTTDILTIHAGVMMTF